MKDEAASALAKARELEPSNSDAWFYAAVVEMQRGNRENALSFLTRAEALEPSRAGLREVRLAAQNSRGQGAVQPEAGAPGSIRLRLIRVRTRQAAEDALKRLNAREDFATLARALSTDSSAGRGGDLGHVVPADLAEPLRSAVTRLAPGETSGVVETTRGFVLVRREP
jgi:parvulin-like peptidyl-prolyl isomerase